ncbi:MAG: hypothetical protein ACLP8S_16220 [Solirubrobacteraceae bacterium]
MNAAVATAIAHVVRAFPDATTQHLDDGQGGAFVIVDGLDLGPAFTPRTTWVGFAISPLYPRADVYPHYVRPDLAKSDGSMLTVPLNPGQVMPGFNRPATMVSRRSNRWDPARDTAVLKLHRVLLWFRHQSTPDRIAA